MKQVKDLTLQQMAQIHRLIKNVDKRKLDNALNELLIRDKQGPVTQKALISILKKHGIKPYAKVKIR